MRLIDADAFTEQYGNYYAEEGPEEEFIGTVGELIAKQPTLEPEVRHGRWISCNEHLPEQGERVIVAIFGSDMIIPNEGETLQDAIERSRKEGYITVGFIGSDGWYGEDWFPLMVQPSYWMPKPDLPEPPEKE